MRALLLVDGASDAPLGVHLGRMAGAHGFELDVVTPDLARLDPPPGLAVADRLAAVLRFDNAFDVVLVHRDAERDAFEVRQVEVESGVRAVHPTMSWVPVVPVRMTEAWLLSDESAIRRVAGRPNGTDALNLPPLRALEELPDPKATLRQALEVASGTAGRRLRQFQRRFGAQRRTLLEQLDPSGAVCSLPAWRQTETDLVRVLKDLASRQSPS